MNRHWWEPRSESKKEFKDYLGQGCIWKCEIFNTRDGRTDLKIVSKNARDLTPRLIRLEVRPDPESRFIDKPIEKNFNFQSEEALIFNYLILYEKTMFILEFLEPTTLIHSLSVLPSTFGDNLKSLLDSGNFSDVKIRAGDLEVDAHKNILASRSPVFMGMFSHESKETIENVVEITDFDADIVQKLLDYIYSDYVDLHEKSEDVRTQLYQAADKYHMDRLKSLCEDMLVRNLTIENAVETLLLADLHKSSELKEKVFRYLIVNTDEISKTESWPKLLEYPKLLSEVLLANRNL